MSSRHITPTTILLSPSLALSLSPSPRLLASPPLVFYYNPLHNLPSQASLGRYGASQRVDGEPHASVATQRLPSSLTTCPRSALASTPLASWVVARLAPTRKSASSACLCLICAGEVKSPAWVWSASTARNSQPFVSLVLVSRQQETEEEEEEGGGQDLDTRAHTSPPYSAQATICTRTSPRSTTA